MKKYGEETLKSWRLTENQATVRFISLLLRYRTRTRKKKLCFLLSVFCIFMTEIFNDSSCFLPLKLSSTFQNRREIWELGHLSIWLFWGNKNNYRKLIYYVNFSHNFFKIPGYRNKHIKFVYMLNLMSIRVNFILDSKIPKITLEIRINVQGRN